MVRVFALAFGALGWLIINPVVHISWQQSPWLESGAIPAAAAATSKKVRHKTRHTVHHPVRRAVRPQVRSHVRGSSGLVTPTPLPAPTQFPTVGVHTPQVTVPQVQRSVPGYETVPQVPAARNESYGDRVTRCMHQGGLGGLNAGQLNTYVPSCAN
jgi:hypothetical protein